MKYYARRLRQLASRVGLCPVHSTKLVCVRCAVRRAGARWLGTPEELSELRALYGRGQPYRDQLPRAGRCRQDGCGGPLACEPCEDNVFERVREPEDLYSPSERVRLDELLGLIAFKHPELMGNL
jgi:hypothetical protein